MKCSASVETARYSPRNRSDGSPKITPGRARALANAAIREACEESLRSLGTDRIWLYQLHAVDPKVPLEKSVETFAELQREGKCQYVGLSNVSVEQIEAARRIVDVVSVQNRLNPYFREALEDGVVEYCEREKITFIAYSPVGGGRLAKKLPKFSLMQELAAKYGTTPHAITIAWVRSKGSTVVPIPAARKEEHARDSAAAGKLVIAAEDLALIDDETFPTT